MSNDKFKMIFIFFLVFVMSSGCGAINQSPTPEASPAAAEPLATATSTPTVAPSLTPTITHTPTPEFKLMDEQLPDLLLSVNRASRYQCNTQGSEETWLASYPYTSPKPLLVSSEVDYRFPTWSPDGEWIAYVESKPEIIMPETGSSGSGKISGSDTLWIIRPDGSEKRQIGDPVPSGLFAGLMGEKIVCDVITEMDSIIAWSPDGQYIIYIQSQIGEGMQWSYSYYITELSSGKTRKLFTQSRRADIYWAQQGNRAFIHSDKDIITFLDIQGIDQIIVNSIALNLPEEVKDTISYEMILAGSKDFFYGIFQYADDNNPIISPNKAMIWSFELSTKQWRKIADVSNKIWVHTNILPSQTLICNEGSHKIQYLEKDSWEQLGEIKLPSNFSFLCVMQPPREILDKARRMAWVIIEATQDETQTGLWAILLRPDDKAVPQLIFDFASIPGNMNELPSYSFRPSR